MTKISKNPEKQTFKLEVWFLCGNDDKDYEVYDIEADSIDEAIIEAESNHRCVLGTYHNGQKVKANHQIHQ